MKTKLLVICGAVFIVGFLFYKFAIGTADVDPALNSLLAMPGVKPGTTDALEQVCCNKASDVGYTDEGDKIVIDYGKQRFYVIKETLKDKDMQSAMNRLHLKIDVKDDETIIMKYKGVEVKPWAD